MMTIGPRAEEGVDAGARLRAVPVAVSGKFFVCFNNV